MSDLLLGPALPQFRRGRQAVETHVGEDDADCWGAVHRKGLRGKTPPGGRGLNVRTPPGWPVRLAVAAAFAAAVPRHGGRAVRPGTPGGWPRASLPRRW